MDEATIRIVLEEGGDGAHPAQTPPPAATSTTAAPPPPKQYAQPQPTAQQAPAPSQAQTTTALPQTTQLPPPPPAQQTQPPQPTTDWMRSLISPAEGANPHVLLEGQSGSGKSLAAKHIAFERMKRGQDVHVVDTHTPEAWGGAKNVFQGATAGTDAADFLKKLLADRKEQATEAKLKGEVPDFKPVSIVFSDFARLMKDTPKLGEEFRTLLTEARKFRVSIIADTTALTGAASGIKGIQDVLNNFGQKVKFFAPTAQGDPRRAEVAGKSHEVPQLPDYKDRTDYDLVQPPKPPPAPVPVLDEAFDPVAEAKKRVDREDRLAQVDLEYAKLRPPKPEMLELAFDPVEVARKRVEREEQQARVDAEYARMKPPKPQDKFGEVLNAAQSLRGTMGGVFGTMVGAVLDAVAAVRKMQAADPGAAVAQSVAPPQPARQQSHQPTTMLAGQSQQQAANRATTSAASTATGTRPTQAAPPPAPAGAGGLSGFAAAAGPVGLAVTAGLIIDQAVKGAVRGVIGGLGSAVKAIASPSSDPAEAIEAMSGAVSKFGEKIPVIGQALVAVGETGKVLAGLMQSFTRQAEKFAEYNPQIAQQLAMSEIRQVMNDMRRAQRSGPELARFIEEQSRMQQQFEEIKMKIWMKILPVITAILQILGRLLGVIEDNQDEDLETPTDSLLRGGVQVPAL